MWPVLSRDSHGAQPYCPHCVFLCPGYNGHERPAGDVMAPVRQGFGEWLKSNLRNPIVSTDFSCGSLQGYSPLTASPSQGRHGTLLSHPPP